MTTVVLAREPVDVLRASITVDYDVGKLGPDTGWQASVWVNGHELGYEAGDAGVLLARVAADLRVRQAAAEADPRDLEVAQTRRDGWVLRDRRTGHLASRGSRREMIAAAQAAKGWVVDGDDFTFFRQAEHQRR